MSMAGNKVEQTGGMTHCASLQKAADNRLDIQALEVHICLAAPHKHDGRPADIHHAERSPNLQAGNSVNNAHLECQQYVSSAGRAWPLHASTRFNACRRL